MSTSAPSNLFRLYKILDPYLDSLRIGGIVGDTKHVAGGGYHISRNDLRSHGQGDDYSIQCPADKRGPGDKASAIDLTLNAAELKLVTTRLRKACTPDSSGSYDPRVEPIREHIGTLDGKNVAGYNRVATGSGSRARVGWHATGFSNSSHLWHAHVSFLRAYCDDVNAIAGVGEVIAGLEPGRLGWVDPSKPDVRPAPAPAQPAPEPTPPVDPDLVIELDAPGSGNWQGAVRQLVSGEWFIGEAQKIAGEDREDAVFHRFDPAGVYLDSMRCQPATGYGLHPTAFGVSSSNVIWVTWNEDTNEVVTFDYAPGATITRADTQPMHVFSDGNVQIGFSPTRDWVALRQIKKDVEIFRRYAKQDVLDGKDMPVGLPITVTRSDDRVVQGFTLINEFLYVITGLNSTPYIEKWSFTTGKLVSKTDISAIGLKAGESGRCEPEGLDGRYFGCKVFTGDARRLRIYRHNL